MENYDVIVIGSGIGGMGAAALLSRLADKRVLVLERHFTLGGFTHAFTRKGYSWDVGLHYVGQMGPGEQVRTVMDLVTDGGVDWHRMPEVFDVFHYPDLTVRQRAGVNNFHADLAEQFPHQRRAIARYLKDVRRAAGWYLRETVGWSSTGPVPAVLRLVNAPTRRLALSTTKDYLQHRFTDPTLRAVLASQWGDYALPPSRSAFAIHALIVAHYLDGGWFPAGGSDALTAGMRAVIEAAGGSCRVNHTVTEILLEDGAAVGVRANVKKGRGGAEAEFRAPVIISDAGARITYGQLLPPHVATGITEKVQQTDTGLATIGVYLGLHDSPQTLGFTGENHWYFGGYDHDETAARSLEMVQGRPSSAYLSFPSLKDPTHTAHTAEILTFVDAELFRTWSDTRWQHRGADYETVKDTIANGLLDLVERHHPGFGQLVSHVEVSTPLTVESFTGYRSGGFGDLAATPERVRQRLVSTHTDVPGLYLAGADVCSLGIAGALMGGVFAAGAVMGPLGVPTIFRAARSRRG